MLLPPSLTRAIESSRILPLLDTGVPDLILTEQLALNSEATIETMAPLYQAAASVASDCVITLAPHRYLPGALLADDSQWHRVASPADISDDDHKLLIDLSATHAEAWFTRSTQAPLLWQIARSYAARTPLLLLGCDARDEDVIGMVGDLRPNPYFLPAGWLLTTDSSEATRERWMAEVGIEVVCGPMPQLIRELREVSASRPQRASGPGRAAERITNPYKSLDYFRLEDWALYFGRERETRRLVELVCANRLVVVTGPSGTGKTSLLQAGLLAWGKWHPPFVGIYTRCEENPRAALTQALRRELDIADLAADATVIEVFEAFASRRRGIPIVVLDQAEELFTRFSDTLRDPFLNDLRRCLVEPGLHARFVLGIRDDFLARLADVRHVVPSILQNTFYVPPLTREAALRAICLPALEADVVFDEEVATKILDEIGSERVAPPQIQIVCDSLFRQREGNRISMDSYTRLGGARAVLNDFMEQQLSNLQRDGALAREVLKAMVTIEGTKDVLPAQEIARRCRDDPQEVQRILLRLRDSCRLVRSVESDAELRFELVHEYLTTSIWAWLSEQDRDRREIEELLIKEIRAWRQFKTIRLGIDRLKRFERSVDLLECTAEALTLFLLSSVAQQQETAIWVDRLRMQDQPAQDDVAAKLFAYFSDKDPNQRCEAAEVIAVLDPSLLLRALDSANATHRRGALAMLGGLQMKTALERIVQCVADADQTCAVLACEALGLIGGAEAVDVLVPIARGADVTLACAAIEALGRAGFPDDCLDFVGNSLDSPHNDLQRAMHSALARGNSNRLLERLLRDPKKVAAVWAVIEHLPTSSRSWLQTLLASVPNPQLEAVTAPSIYYWVGDAIENEKYRRQMKSQFRKWSADSIQQQVRHCEPTKLGSVLRNLSTSDRMQAISELAKRGAALDEAIHHLATDSAPDVRRIALDIVMAREQKPDLSLPRELFEKAIGDADPSVQCTACELAAHFELWPPLEKVIRSEPKRGTRVRASALRGLATTQCFIPVHLLERALGTKESEEGPERYWACLVAKHQKLTHLLSMIRPLAWDKTAVGFTGYDRKLGWPGHDRSIGHTVSEAANAALAVLAPNSGIWRRGVS